MTNFITVTALKDNLQLTMKINIDDISRYHNNLNNASLTDIYLKSSPIFFSVIGTMTDIEENIKKQIPS